MTGTSETLDLDALADLQLDPRNPRLRRDEEDSPQDRLIEIMLRRFKIEELAESIVASGYLPFDPMIGYRGGDAVFVREGNRRLAAVKLLLDPEIAPDRQRSKWREFAERLGERRAELEKLNVTVYDSSEDIELTSYIGFRHVTGVLQWPALEKASFIALMIDQGMDYRAIAERLGSYPRHVERHYIAYQIVQQAVDGEVAGHENLEDSFGVLLRALQASGVTEFIGVTYPGDPAASRTPVPTDHWETFQQFVRWTFGTKDVTRVLPDSRKLTEWGKILQSHEAVRYLSVTAEPRFERAWFNAGGQADNVRESLWAAAYRLEETVPLVVQFRQDSEVEEAVRQCALFLGQISTYFPSAAEAFGLPGTGSSRSDSD